MAGEITFGKAWSYGGWLMWVLVFVSILALAMMFYIWYSQRPGIFLPEALSRVKAAKDPEAEGSRLAARLYSTVDWLADIAAIAPLIGLLGTVIGLFQAFGGVASPEVAVGDKQSALIQGVSQAIVTTIFGLVIAIPAMAAHALFRRRAARLVATFEEKADEVLA
ncbi:MAG: MotA/TolQ/ExbB proton channel family protein [Kiritimatiellia bacterium]